MQKRTTFCGTSLEDLRGLPRGARREAGFQLNKVQDGEDPDDWKPMAGIGPGALEIRIRDSTGAYRVVYVAKFPEAVYVLHVFKKKGQKTSLPDLQMARQRYRELLRNRS
jgi:phage-related protein